MSRRFALALFAMLIVPVSALAADPPPDDGKLRIVVFGAHQVYAEYIYC